MWIVEKFIWFFGEILKPFADKSKNGHVFMHYLRSGCDLQGFTATVESRFNEPAI